MNVPELKAVVDAIKLGVLAQDSPLSLLDAKRKLVTELVDNARQDFKQQVEALAARIP